MRAKRALSAHFSYARPNVSIFLNIYVYDFLVENFDDEAIKREARQTELRQRDFDDLQREVVGLDVGRIARFLKDGARGDEVAEKRKQDRAEALTRLQLMMRDPAYAALYNDTMNRLGEAERATEIALAKALERQRLADEALGPPGLHPRRQQTGGARRGARAAGRRRRRAT